MLFNRILINLSLLSQGKIKAREIPPKIANRILNYSGLIRHAKRSRFVINDVIFRTIEQNDNSNYCEFFNNYFKEIVPRTENKISIPECNSETFCYVALYRNKIVGKVELRKALSDTASMWRVGGLSILQDFRGYGIGEELLKKVISAIQEKNPTVFLGLNKDNKRALKLYRKLGFRVANEQERPKIRSMQYPSQKIMMVKGA